MSASPQDWIRLHSEHFTAEIDAHGAQLSVLRDAEDRDLLWDGNPHYWTGRAPILFPIVGALNGGAYRWRGATYPLARHGLARHHRFEVASAGGQSACLRLKYNEDTLKVYPFRFELELVFALAGSVCEIEARIHNLGDAPMPASIGFHPAFLWPPPGGAKRSDCYLEFDEDEPAPIRRLDADGLQRPEGLPTPIHAHRLMLDDALFADDVLILEQPRSRSVTFGGPTGTRIRTTFGPVSHLGIWSKPGAGFVCIEPWRGVADPAGFTGEFDAKPGMLMVPPGQEESLTLRIETC